MNLVSLLAPEILLIAVACALFLLGVSRTAAARRFAPVVALVALLVVFLWQLVRLSQGTGTGFGDVDPTGTVRGGDFPLYIKMLVSGMGVLLVLLAWPTNADATGAPSIYFGYDASEFFALMLLSLSGVFLVASANDIILLFLGIELASIPTYIMVSISRPLPVAQEAGVKYFFLGAMAAAIMLFGFSYLYGTTGLTKLDQIGALFNHTRAGEWLPAALNTWQLLAVVMLLAGFAFKIAAVPLHAYAGDVYQGAATPVTAFLAFVPKTSGFVAIISVLSAVGGSHWAVPPLLMTLIAVVAAFTMSVGNVLGLLQSNVKRVLAYSSIAHSGYMLVGIAALVSAARAAGPHMTTDAADAIVATQQSALGGVLFYLAAYGVMNAGAFGVLMLLPSRSGEFGGSTVATTAETFEDLSGQGKRYPLLGLAMAVCCFSLIGLPLTVGLVGKVYLIQPALRAGLTWLVVLTMVNSAVSAAYYLRIVATMFLRPLPDAEPGAAPTAAVPLRWPAPIALAVLLAVFGTILFGTILPATNRLTNGATQAAHAGASPAVPTAQVSEAR